MIYIMSDDHAAHAIGAYGGRLLKLNPTPTIDRLANKKGSVERRIPICAQADLPRGIHNVNTPSNELGESQ